jgi:hypothetical protein
MISTHNNETDRPRLEAERHPDPALVANALQRKRKRLIRRRAADVGKEAQDMREPTVDNISTKKVCKY